MGFKLARRTGKYWDDAERLHKLINKHNFNNTSKNEREFEIGLGNALDTLNDQFNCRIISQTNKDTRIESIYCFGKKHRPDIALDDDGIAIELKHITYAGLKDAIGQGYLYRLQYRFVFIVLVISKTRKTMYEDLCNGKEKDLEETLQHLADNMGIFTYIVPAFALKSGPSMKKCHSFFESLNK